MDVTLILSLITGLVVVLAVLIFLLFLRAKKKNLKTVETTPEEEKQDLDTLLRSLENKKRTSGELKEILGLVLKHYPTINEFEIYRDILYSITLHPNTNKNIILNFDKELSRLNPKYKEEISKAVTEGLNSRGV